MKSSWILVISCWNEDGDIHQSTLSPLIDCQKIGIQPDQLLSLWTALFYNSYLLLSYLCYHNHWNAFCTLSMMFLRHPILVSNRMVIIILSCSAVSAVAAPHALTLFLLFLYHLDISLHNTSGSTLDCLCLL